MSFLENIIGDITRRFNPPRREPVQKQTPRSQDDIPPPVLRTQQPRVQRAGSQPGRSELTTVPNRLRRAASDISSFMNENLERRNVPRMAIPAWEEGHDPETFEPKRIRMGQADPEVFRKNRETGEVDPPSHPLSVVGRELLSILPFTGEEPALPVGLGNIVVDATSRLQNARRHAVNDPDTWVDDPVYEYTLPSGQQFTSEDREKYYMLKDGTVASHKDLDERVGIDPIIIQSGDPRASMAQEDDQGRLILPTRYRLPDGQIIRYEDLPGTPEEWDAAVSHYAFPDGTVTMKVDGTVPEESRNLARRQIRSGESFDEAMEERMENRQRMIDQGEMEDEPLPKESFFRRFLGVANPRAPWVDQAGYNAFLDEEFDVGRNTFDEAGAWAADVALGMAPYMAFGPIGAGVIAASQAMPAIYGYDAATYEPVGQGFENLGSLGQGTFENRHMTNAQAVGAFTRPIVEATVERLGGSVIGGLPKGMARAFDHPALSPVGAALREGTEELAIAPLEQLREDSVANYGRERVWNEVTGEWVYDPESARWSTMPEIMLNNFLTGAAMGGALGGGRETLGYFDRRRTSGTGPATVEANVVEQPAQDILKDKDLGTLENRRQNVRPR